MSSLYFHVLLITKTKTGISLNLGYFILYNIQFWAHLLSFFLKFLALLTCPEVQEQNLQIGLWPNTIPSQSVIQQMLKREIEKEQINF